MKILYITSDYLYNIGGIYQHIENLSYFISKKHQVSIIYLNKEDKEECIEDQFNRKIYFVKNAGTQIERFFKYPTSKIKEIIKKESPDLIHIHTLFEAVRLPNSIKSKSIFTNHSSSYLKMYDKFLLKNYLIPQSFKKFSLIISPSTELYQKTPHHNSIMIPNGVNLDRFDISKRNNIDKSKLLEKYNIKYNNQRILLSTRRLVDKNGIFDFINSNIPFFKNNENNFIYILIGNGSDYSKIQKIIEENQIKNIFLLGQVENKLIDDFYYISDISLIPSKMEAISISALESMASGSVVLSTSVGGLGELIENNINGKFLENLSLEKAIEYLYSDNNLERIQLKSLEVVKNKYSWEKIADITIEAYNNR